MIIFISPKSLILRSCKPVKMRQSTYVLLICLLMACQKKRAPLVTILSPANEQVFRIGDTVNVQAELSDADILLGQYLTVVSGRNDTDTVIQFQDHAQQSMYRLSKQFIVQTSDTFRIVVSAYGGSSIMTKKEVFVFTH